MAGDALTLDLGSRLARIILAGIQREYPNKLDHVLIDEQSLQSPRRLHPAFFGCFDWHSAVHAHWTLARLLRLVPALPEAGAIRATIDRTLTRQNIAAEVAYLSRPLTGSFERSYGWAWLLKLAEELARSPACRAWSEALAPLAEAFASRYLAFLPRARYPNRTGVHANTAFGLSFAHGWAGFSGHDTLRSLVERKALDFFAADRDYPAHFEPGGADFFSAALTEADLMRRVLPSAEFAAWFDRFLPGAREGRPDSLFIPAVVTDRADLQLVHLDGLNLSRAWCMRTIAAALPGAHAAIAALSRSADSHTSMALPHVASGDYAGEHWLATFAMLALTGDA